LHRRADTLLLLIINFYCNVLRLLDVETSVNTIIIQPTLIHTFINFMDTHPNSRSVDEVLAQTQHSEALVFPVRSLEKLLLSDPNGLCII